jgi:hypothetical protein
VANLVGRVKLATYSFGLQKGISMIAKNGSFDEEL